MTKQEFLKDLRKKLVRIHGVNADERIAFYSETIDDRIEEGLSEEEAVAEIPSVDEIAAGIRSELTQAKEEEKAKKEKKETTRSEKILLVLGAPFWLPLLLAGLAVVLALYVVMWSVIVTLWAVEAVFFIFANISKVLFVVCKSSTVVCGRFTRESAARIKSIFSEKEE